MDDLVSIVIPTRNRPDLLARALTSAVHQTYPRLEIIVVNDDSSMDVAPTIERFHDDRIRLLRHEGSKGCPAARNMGIVHAQGRYIAFLDDDDEWTPDKIAAQMSDLAEKEQRYKVSYCLREICHEESKKATRVHTQGWDGDHLDQLIAGAIRPPPSCFLVARECLEQVGGFREDLRNLEDRELWIRLAQYYEFAFVDRFLVRMHVGHGIRMSDNKEARLEAYSIIYEAHKKLLWKHRSSLSEFLMEYGFELRDHGERRKALMQFAKAAAATPFRREPYIALGSMLTGPRQIKAR